MALPDEKTSFKRIKKQVDQTIGVSEILSGRAPIGGTLGKKIKQQQEQEKDAKQGKDARIKKFKKFDDYLERMELIANDFKDEKKIKIRRALIKDPKNPNKVI